MIQGTQNDAKELGLNAEKFEFLLLAIREITEPLIGQEKFRVTMEKDPESRDITIRYNF